MYSTASYPYVSCHKTASCHWNGRKLLWRFLNKELIKYNNSKKKKKPRGFCRGHKRAQELRRLQKILTSHTHLPHSHVWWLPLEKRCSFQMIKIQVFCNVITQIHWDLRFYYGIELLGKFQKQIWATAINCWTNSSYLKRLILQDNIQQRSNPGTASSHKAVCADFTKEQHKVIQYLHGKICWAAVTRWKKLVFITSSV